MDHMLWIGEGVIAKNKVKTLKEVLKKLAGIKPSDITRVAGEVLDGGRYNLAVVGPITMPQEKELRRLLAV